MSEDNDSAEYQDRLEEIFLSCDSGSKGFLSLLEFERLCQQLQLQSHKPRLYRDLGLSRTSANSKVYFEDFKTVLVTLLQEVGPDTFTDHQQPHRCYSTDSEGNTSDDADWTVQREETRQNTNHALSDADLRLCFPPDMTEDDDGDIDQAEAVEEMPEEPGKLSPSFSLKRAYVEDQGDHNEGRKQPRSSSPAEAETFEADGLLASTPLAEDSAGMDSDSGLLQLRHVCNKLGLGPSGYLTQTELGQVCQYIGMEQMYEEELEVLFNKLDVDHDGLISFGEFVEGLAAHTATPRAGFETPTKSPALRPQSGRKNRTPLPPSHHDRRSPAVYASGDHINLFSSLPSDGNSGIVTMEEVLDYWEQLNVTNGAEILLGLGFDPEVKISLKELSLTLGSEWSSLATDSNGLAHAITATYHQELVCLRSWLDQTSEERDKLRSDLGDALSRNALMASEVDEHHAQLEHAHELHIKEMEQEHQEQLRQLQSELEREQEAHSSQAALYQQTSEQLNDLQHQVSTLKDRLAHADNKLSESKKELSTAQEKQSEWEFLYHQLQKELEQQHKQAQPDSPHNTSWEKEQQAAIEKAELYATQNKELKDHNDELVAQLEELQQQVTSVQHQNSAPSTQPRSNSFSRIPVRTRTSSVSSAGTDTSEWDDDDLMSSTDAMFFCQHGLSAPDESDKAPSLSKELKQQQRQKRGERRERERKEIEHSFRVEISELEDRHEEDKKLLQHNFDKEKARLWEDYQNQTAQQLAEQQKELQNAYTMEKQDLLQQYESRLNLTHLQHQQELQALQDRLNSIQERTTGEVKENPTTTTTNSQSQSLSGRVEELQQVKAELERQQVDLRSHYEGELGSLRARYDQDIAQLKDDLNHRVQAALAKIFEEGADSLEGQLKEDFDHLVQQHVEEQSSGSDPALNKEALCAAFEQDKMELVQHYESQIVTLREELQSLRNDFETERAAFQQLHSGDLAQSIRQDLQDEMGGQVDELRQSWEEERRELMVQNQLLEEELADLKGLLTQERQRSAEAHTLKETVRRLRGENKEVQCLAESLKEKVGRIHQQQDLERANYERKIDELVRDKDQALRVQALQHAGTWPASSERQEEAEKGVLQKVIEEVQAADTDSPVEPVPSQSDQENLDQLQGQITQLHHQLQEARTAQFEFQQLKDECELLRQKDVNLEEMVRVLRQRSDKKQVDREREEQDQLHELWEEKKKLQNLLQRTTDKLLKTSTEMAAGQTQLVREVENLKQKAGSMVELETYTRLQVSLLETQRHAISLQEALIQRTQLADRIMAETEKERRKERESWEQEKREMQSRFDTTTEMYRSLAAQHKALRQSTTKLATQLKDLYVENADLMSIVQQTEAKQIAAQRRNRKLQRQCQAWHDAVHRMLHKKNHDHPIPVW